MIVSILVALGEAVLIVLISAAVAWKVTSLSLANHLRQREAALRKMFKGVL